MPGKLDEWQTINSRSCSFACGFHIKHGWVWKCCSAEEKQPDCHSICFIHILKKIIHPLKGTAKEKTADCIYLKHPCTDNPLREKGVSFPIGYLTSTSVWEFSSLSVPGSLQWDLLRLAQAVLPGKGLLELPVHPTSASLLSWSSWTVQTRPVASED